MSFARSALRRLPPGPLALLVIGSGMLAPGIAGAQELRLGEVDFPNSGAPGAQAAFERGLLLLHSFEYETAAEAFREAQELDSDFAMAYWGEAMTYNHPVWMRQDRDAALDALRRYAPTAEERALAAGAGPDGAGTEREAAYMRAVDILYGEGEKETRDDAYLEAMAALHEAYPEDAEAAAFHALAHLGSAHEGRDFAIYMRSAAILEQVVDGHPDHPGIAHYLIHSYDDPIHAPLGIRAARAYSEIAPDAAHAQHMTSHIFVALGMWDDVVEANENSTRVVDEQRAAEGEPPAACGHYNFWLEYGYLQRGREQDALRLVRECHARVTTTSGEERPPIGSFGEMLARYVIDTGDAAPLDRLRVDWSEARWAQVAPLLAVGVASHARGDGAGVRGALEEFRAARTAIEAELSAEGAEAGNGFLGHLDILELELEALAASAAGDPETAVRLAREAAVKEAERPFQFGPPSVDKPTHELLGELLLRAGRAEEARTAFETALSRTPGRVQAEAGLRAAEGELQARAD